MEPVAIPMHVPMIDQVKIALRIIGASYFSTGIFETRSPEIGTAKIDAAMIDIAKNASTAT